MYSIGCTFVVLGYLPDVVLRRVIWDDTLLAGTKPLLIVLGQFLRPVIFSVVLPLIAIYSDKRVKSGVVESVKSIRCFLGYTGYMMTYRKSPPLANCNTRKTA